MGNDIGSGLVRKLQSKTTMLVYIGYRKDFFWIFFFMYKKTCILNHSVIYAKKSMLLRREHKQNLFQQALYPLSYHLSCHYPLITYPRYCKYICIYFLIKNLQYQEHPLRGFLGALHAQVASKIITFYPEVLAQI